MVNLFLTLLLLALRLQKLAGETAPSLLEGVQFVAGGVPNVLAAHAIVRQGALVTGPL